MATADGKCGYHLGNGRVCQNRVRQGTSHCYMHAAKMQTETLDSITSDAELRQMMIEMMPEIVNPIPLHSFSNMFGETSADLISDEIKSEDIDMILLLLQAAENIREQFQPTIPSNALSLNKQINDEFCRELVELGVQESRLSRIEMAGVAVRGFDQFPISSETIRHEAVLVDEGTDSEFVVDPCIAALAPVFDLDSPVEDQMPIGSPFTDYPWIASLDNYLDGGYVSWMRDLGDMTEEEEAELSVLDQMRSDPDFANAEVEYGDEGLVSNTIVDVESDTKMPTLEEYISQAVMPSEYIDGATQEDDEAYAAQLTEQYEKMVSQSGFLNVMLEEEVDEDDDPFSGIG